MKRNILPALIILLTLFVSGCEELKDPAGRRGESVVPIISEADPGVFIIGDGDSFIEFEVDFASGEEPGATEVLVSYGDNLDRLKIEDLTTFPATVSITLSEALDILGIALSDVQIGDVLIFEILTTKDGLTTRSIAAHPIPVVCVYEPALAYGSYRAVSGGWQVNGSVVVTPDPNDQYTIFVSGLARLDGLNEDRGPLVMHINPSSFKVTADKTVVATSAFGYHNLAYAGTGTFNSCTGLYQMNFNITVDEGNFGTYAFTITRN